jgi:hypothetical protein
VVFGKVTSGDTHIDHASDLLQTSSQGLGDTVVDEEDGDDTTSGVDPTDHGSQVGLIRVEQVRQGEGDGPSGDPEERSSERDDLGLVLSVRQLGGTSPSERTPGQVEGEDVKHDHGDDGSVHGLGTLVRLDDTNSSNDDIGEGHEDTSVDQQGSSTESVDQEEGNDDTDNLENVDNDGVEESVGLTDILKELGGVGEDELDSGDLLTDQDSNGHVETPSVGRNVNQIGPLGGVSFVVVLDVSSLDQDGQFGLGITILVVLVNSLQSGESLLVLALADQPSWGFGNEPETDEDGENDGDVESDGESPGEGGSVVLGSLSDDSSDNLIASRESSV